MPSPAVDVATLAAAAPAPEELAERARALLADDRFQRALPDAPTPPRLDWDLDWLLWVLGVSAAIAVVVALALVVRWLLSRLRHAAPGAELPAPAAAAPHRPVPIPVANAEALAAEGRFGEAIHQLLLDTLAALSRAARLAPSLTSREIVARVPLAPAAREALAGLVAAVEISFFGGAAPGPEDYRACRARFDTFLETYRRPA